MRTLIPQGLTLVQEERRLLDLLYVWHGIARAFGDTVGEGYFEHNIYATRRRIERLEGKKNGRV